MAKYYKVSLNRWQVISKRLQGDTFYWRALYMFAANMVNEETARQSVLYCQAYTLYTSSINKFK